MPPSVAKPRESRIEYGRVGLSGSRALTSFLPCRASRRRTRFSRVLSASTTFAVRTTFTGRVRWPARGVRLRRSTAGAPRFPPVHIGEHSPPLLPLGLGAPRRSPLLVGNAQHGRVGSHRLLQRQIVHPGQLRDQAPGTASALLRFGPALLEAHVSGMPREAKAPAMPGDGPLPTPKTRTARHSPKAGGARLRCWMVRQAGLPALRAEEPFSGGGRSR